MCRQKLLMAVLVFFGHLCQAQDKTKYFNRSGRETTKELAYVYKVKKYDEINNDSITTYFFTGNNAVQSQYVLGDSSQENSIINFESGKIKQVEQYKADMNSYQRLVFYPDGKYQRLDIIPRSWRNLFFNSLIWSYWDSTGTEIITEGNGYCRCYYLTSDSAAIKYREEGQLTAGYREGEWLTYQNDTLRYREVFSKGVLQHGVRYGEASQKQYDNVEIPPEFPGGKEKLYEFVKNQLYYPLDARKDKITGKVFVSFVVEADGSVTNIKLIKGLSKSIDNEAIKIVEKMPKWNPAGRRGKNVSFRFVLPINFGLR